MRRSNKLLAFFLSLVVFLSFAGCSADVYNNPNCSNMKNPSQVTLQEAIDQGYEICKKCY